MLGMRLHMQLAFLQAVALEEKKRQLSSLGTAVLVGATVVLGASVVL
jgi:hypothetical protein